MTWPELRCINYPESPAAPPRSAAPPSFAATTGTASVVEACPDTYPAGDAPEKGAALDSGTLVEDVEHDAVGGPVEG